MQALKQKFLNREGIALYCFTALTFTIIFLFTDIAFSQFYEIDEIEFIHTDKETIEDSELEDAVGVTNSKYYYSDALIDDVVSLRNYYFDNGYFEAEVKKVLSFNDTDSTVSIKFLITENQHYRTGNILNTGLNKVNKDLMIIIDTMKTLRTGNYFKKDDMIDYSTAILDLLQNNGYMNATLKTDSGYVVLKQDSTVNITINFVRADTIYRFGKTEIIIDSNVYDVSREFLSNGIAYNEGDIYSKKKRLDTEKNISQMPIIRSVRIRTSSIEKDIVNLKVDCKLSNRQEFTPFIEATNISNYFYAGGGLKYLNKYIWGGGRILTSEIHALYSKIDVNLIELVTNITQPYFFNSKSSLNDKLSVGYYNFDGYTNYYLGNVLSFRYYIADHTFYNKATIDLSEEFMKFKYTFGAMQEVNLFNSFLSFTLIHDNTNNAIAPFKGFYHSITAGEGGLLPGLILNAFENNMSYSKFFKISTSNRFYYNVSDNEGENVIASKFLTAVNITYGSGEKIVPIQPIYRYFSGGSNSMRGWLPLGNGFVNDRRIGGNFLLESSIEFRKVLFPSSTSFTKNFKAVVFADFGNVWETIGIFRADQIAFDIGAGLRYNIFIGPVRVDFGFKIYDPLDIEGRKWITQNSFANILKEKITINFGIGEAF